MIEIVIETQAVARQVPVQSRLAIAAMAIERLEVRPVNSAEATTAYT